MSTHLHSRVTTGVKDLTGVNLADGHFGRTVESNKSLFSGRKKKKSNYISKTRSEPFPFIGKRGTTYDKYCSGGIYWNLGF